MDADPPSDFAPSCPSTPTENTAVQTDDSSSCFGDGPPPYSPVTPSAFTSRHEFWPMESEVIEQERAVYAEYCQNCTCYLDPVELNYSDSFSFEQVAVHGDSWKTMKRRNKLNLTIDTSATKAKNWCFSDPMYELIMNSPVVKKLREFGFTYPREEEPWRRKFLHCAIAILLLLVIILIVINAVVPHLLNHVNEQIRNERNFSEIPLRYYLIPDFSTKNTVYKGPPTNKPTLATEAPPIIALITRPPFEHSKQTTSRVADVAMTESLTTTTPGPSFFPTSTKAPKPSTSTGLAVSTWLPSFPANVICGQYQFRCRNGVSRVPCLDDWERCDGIQDCSDGSDEQFCDKLTCYGNFQCSNGQCVQLDKVCNGVADCLDGSDEDVCDAFKCKPYEYRCPSGYCIPHEWLCDGEGDCPDHRDEFNCSSSCSPDQFRCSEGWCIPEAWRCNGIPDCAKGEDEVNCSCAVDQTKCSSGACFDKSQTCDGVEHCADGSDEWNCVSNDAIVRVRDRETNEMLPVCADGWTADNSASLCQQMGYSKMVEHGFVSIGSLNESHMFLLSKEKQTNLMDNSRRLQYSVDKIPAEDCTSRRAISVTCKQFECGVWHPTDRVLTRAKRVVGGHVSAKHQWPSVVVLYHPHKRWTCTASILSPLWAISSALCVKRTDPNPFDWRLVAGSAAPNETDTNVMKLKIERFVLHPSYRLRTVVADHDLVLVKLATPLDFDPPITGRQSDVVGAICMPTEKTEPDTLCVTAGWGYTTPGGFFINKQLRHLSMDVWEGEKCNSSDHYNSLITDRMVCARNENQNWGPCFNDEGAPLMCHSPSSGAWYLAGVLTTQSCGSRHHPAVFADTFAMRRWIEQTIFGTDYGPG